MKIPVTFPRVDVDFVSYEEKYENKQRAEILSTGISNVLKQQKYLEKLAKIVEEAAQEFLDELPKT